MRSLLTKACSATKGYMRLRRVTLGVTQCYMGLLYTGRVTWRYTRLHEAAQGYVGVHR